jgi:hypothetical protein
MTSCCIFILYHVRAICNIGFQLLLLFAFLQQKAFLQQATATATSATATSNSRLTTTVHWTQYKKLGVLNPGGTGGLNSANPLLILPSNSN